MLARIAGLALALVAALTLAACGSSGGHHKAVGVIHEPNGAKASIGTRDDCRANYGRTVHVLAQQLGTACPLSTNLRAAPPAATADRLTQYDSTENNIPPSAQAAAGYVNGIWRSYSFFAGHFPHVIGIAVDSDNRSYGGTDCADFEPSPGRWQNDPSNAGPWAAWQRTQGNAKPCVYTMLSEMPQVKASLAHSLGPNWRSEVRLWDANWTYVPHVDADPSSPTGAYDGTQYTDHCLNLNLDCSVMQASFYGQPVPPPDPNYNPSFNVGYAAGIGGAYRKGYNADHHPSTVEAAAFNAGFSVGYSKAKAAGQAARHRVPQPTTFNASFNWGWAEGWAAGRAGTYRVWFGVLYAHPSSPTGAASGYKLAFPKSFNQAFTSGYKAGK